MIYQSKTIGEVDINRLELLEPIEIAALYQELTGKAVISRKQVEPAYDYLKRFLNDEFKFDEGERHRIFFPPKNRRKTPRAKSMVAKLLALMGRPEGISFQECMRVMETSSVKHCRFQIYHINRLTGYGIWEDDQGRIKIMEDECPEKSKPKSK